MAIREGDWKLVRGRGEDRAQLYNLKEDIGEQRDLGSENQEIMKKLQNEWDVWDKTLVAPAWIPQQRTQPNRRANRAN